VDKVKKAIIVLENGDMILKDKEYIQKLYSSGFGSMRGEVLKLDPLEVLYLVYTNRARVLENGKEIPFKTLVRMFQKNYSDIWIKFLIYHDLRQRGFITMKGYTTGLELRVAEKKAEKNRPKTIVFGLVEGRKVKFSSIRFMIDRAMSLGKNVVLAIVDKEGNITYYTVSFSRSTMTRDTRFPSED